MCQADDGAKCTDGVAPDGALQSGPEGDAEGWDDDHGIVWPPAKVTRRGRVIWDDQVTLRAADAAEKIVYDLGFLVPKGYRAAFRQRLAEGILRHVFGSPDEEPRSGDTVRAEDQSASLTHKNNLGTVELSDD